MSSRVSYIILLSSISVIGFAQNRYIDSLKNVLATTTNDTVRIRLMGSLCFNYQFVNADSSLYYGQEALELARSKGNLLGEVEALGSLSLALRKQGRLAETMDLQFKALRMAEVHGFKIEIARSLRRLGLVYFDLEDYNRALDYHRRALDLYAVIRSEEQIIRQFTNMANAFEKLNQLDSAWQYALLALPRISLTPEGPGILLAIMGDIQLKMNHRDSAARFYCQGLETCLEQNDFHTASLICSQMSKMFSIRDQADSARHYAGLGLDYSRRVAFKKGIMLNAGLLADGYEFSHPSLAMVYYKLASSARDSLLGLESIKTIHALVAREEARQQELEEARAAYENRLRWMGAITILAALAVISIILYRGNKQKLKANRVLQNTLNTLKTTQAQLIQSEKMASLGELTAGIAHEIQNPLNFVNNFSEVNKELIEEFEEEWSIDSGGRKNPGEIQLIHTIKENQDKILQHGKRADAIEKGMLAHSRKSTGEKVPTDINALADECLRLSYHGMRAKESSFKADYKIDFDPNLPKVNVIPQDIARVLLNLINNAFQAVNGFCEKPTVTVSTKKWGDGIQITVSDNGPGIPDSIKDKIFQPFFTTKSTGKGTGLGLSLAYDIVKAHGGNIKVISNQDPPGGTIVVNSVTRPPGGEINVKSRESEARLSQYSSGDLVGQGSEFILQLPVQ